MSGLRLLSAIVGMLIGAMVTGILTLYVGSLFAEVLPFGDKSGVFSAALFGVPLGASLGYTVSAGIRWRITFKAAMVAFSTIIGGAFSFGFLAVALLVFREHALVAFLLQFLSVLGTTLLVGKIISPLSNPAASVDGP